MRSTLISDEARWERVAARDPTADGAFVFAVRTTGIYCRPSCGARRPRLENVTFHTTPADAERAGFRACRRCHPDRDATPHPDARRIAGLCRLIEGRDGSPSLQELARRAGMSRFHFQRRFKALTGMTPKTYAAGCRAERLQGALRSSRSVTEAIYSAGYGSSAAFYQQADRWLGMTPSAVRAGGAGVAIRFVMERSSLGMVLVAATERGICAVALGDDAEGLTQELAHRFPRASRELGGPDMQALVAAVLRLIENPAADAAALPLDIRGTAFQVRVWAALTRIPAGRTVSYAQLAAAVGSPNGARAVAAACASNHLAVVIPCHRVVRGDGALSGYRWGVARKRALLERERATKPSKP